MRAKKIYNIAKEIKPRMSKEKIIKLFEDKNLEIEYLGSGCYKRAFKVTLNNTAYALKVGNSVRKDFEDYNSIKKNKHYLFKIYWCEDYVTLQKFSVKPTS